MPGSAKAADRSCSVLNLRMSASRGGAAVLRGMGEPPLHTRSGCRHYGVFRPHSKTPPKRHQHTPHPISAPRPRSRLAGSAHAPGMPLDHPAPRPRPIRPTLSLHSTSQNARNTFRDPPPNPAPIQALAPDLARRVALIVAGLAALVAHRFLREPRLVSLIVPLWTRLTRTARRFERLMAHIANNRPPKPRPSGPHRPTDTARRGPAPRRPRLAHPRPAAGGRRLRRPARIPPRRAGRRRPPRRLPRGRPHPPTPRPHAGPQRPRPKRTAPKRRLQAAPKTPRDRPAARAHPATAPEDPSYRPSAKAPKPPGPPPADATPIPPDPPLPNERVPRAPRPLAGCGAEPRPSCYFTGATRSALVVPGCPNGTPAITTISSPRVANPSTRANRAARGTVSDMEWTPP